MCRTPECANAPRADMQRQNLGEAISFTTHRRLVIRPLTPGLMPLTVREVKRLAATVHRSSLPSLAGDAAVFFGLMRPA